MAFKMKGFSGFKQVKATKAIKQVNTSKDMDTQREIYKAKLRGDYVDATGGKLKEMSYDDPTGTVVSKGFNIPDSPVKQGEKFDSNDQKQREALNKYKRKLKKGKPYFKSSAETMVPPYKRPVGPTEKRHGIHKGKSIMDGMDTEFQPYKIKFGKRPHLKSPAKPGIGVSPNKNYKKGYYGA